MMSKVLFEQDGEVGIITISDPPLNLFGLELIAALITATAEAQAAPIRALLLRSEGEHFTAGAQVDEVFGGLTEAEGAERIEGFLELAQRTERLPFPTLAAVRGLCLAAGLETVLTLDLIWASDTAQFAFAEPIIGLTPIIGGAYRLAARVGTGRAIETVFRRGRIRRQRSPSGASSIVCCQTPSSTRSRSRSRTGSQPARRSPSTSPRNCCAPTARKAWPQPTG
jgi:enoyl-CoA hydratase/carnithine racemase